MAKRKYTRKSDRSVKRARSKRQKAMRRGTSKKKKRISDKALKRSRKQQKKSRRRGKTLRGGATSDRPPFFSPRRTIKRTRPQASARRAASGWSPEHLDRFMAQKLAAQQRVGPFPPRIPDGDGSSESESESDPEPVGGLDIVGEWVQKALLTLTAPGREAATQATLAFLAASANLLADTVDRPGEVIKRGFIKVAHEIGIQNPEQRWDEIYHEIGPEMMRHTTGIKRGFEMLVELGIEEARQRIYGAGELAGSVRRRSSSKLREFAGSLAGTSGQG